MHRYNATVTVNVFLRTLKNRSRGNRKRFQVLDKKTYESTIITEQLSKSFASLEDTALYRAERHG